MSTSPAFVHEVSRALAHLYDPDVLCDHTLVNSFNLIHSQNKHAALRELLISEIESLKPDPSVPGESRAWRIYRILFFRYIQQLEQEQTAYQVGISVRHLRREQQIAVKTLADSLSEKFGIGTIEDPNTTSEEAASLEAELSWLKDPLAEKFADLSETLQAALHLVTPMATAHGIHFETDLRSDIPLVQIHPAGLRQAIVSATTHVINHIGRGSLHFSIWQEGEYGFLRVETATSQNATDASQEGLASLLAAQVLLKMYNASINIDDAAEDYSITIALPILDLIMVLIVDDNQDIAQLFERYTFDSRYKIHHSADTGTLFNFSFR